MVTHVLVALCRKQLSRLPSRSRRCKSPSKWPCLHSRQNQLCKPPLPCRQVIILLIRRCISDEVGPRPNALASREDIYGRCYTANIYE